MFESIGTLIVTAYCACSLCCGHSHGMTKSGIKAEAEWTLACSKDRMNQVLYIEGFGIGRCEDTGKNIGKKRIDIFVKTHSAGIAFGKQKVNVWRLR